jgi:hypothetical protein
VKSAVAIVIDGVLRREIGYQPIPEGLELYRVLAPHYNLVLLADDYGEAYEEELDHFMHVEQLRQHGMVYYSGDKDRVGQVNWLRNTGRNLAFVIEPDPLQSADLMLAGFNVMHFMHAQYTRPDWRPDAGHNVAPWDELVRHEVALKGAKASDKRTAQ